MFRRACDASAVTLPPLRRRAHAGEDIDLQPRLLPDELGKRLFSLELRARLSDNVAVADAKSLMAD